MSDDKRKWASIAIRPTYGTARLIRTPVVLPQDKGVKEVFWVEALTTKLPTLSALPLEIRLNDDDSHGNHDVLIKIQGDCTIGVQVTELTSELRRKREAIRASYLQKFIDLLKKNNVKSEEKILVKLLFTSSNPEELNLEKPECIIKAIENKELTDSPRVVDNSKYRVLIEKIGEKDFYVPNTNNIGIEVDFDQVPRSLETYQKAINYIAEKKSKSKSPWLLVWSLDFWMDKHTFGEDAIDHMRSVFADSNFEKIYFIESLNGVGPFEANLTLYIIKE
jgi:hypothetical protein